MRAALRKCAEPGCHQYVEGGRCEVHQKREENRGSATERGYDDAWRKASAAYRRLHPLCVNCELRGLVKKCRLVDHIVPIACCHDLRMEPGNWAALCYGCHTYKTAREPKHEWTPDPERIVVCGLPGTGKSTWAGEQGLPTFDANEMELRTGEEIKSARRQWIEQQAGACIVIVASTITASILAGQLRGTVKHMATRHCHRGRRQNGSWSANEQ